MAIGFVLPYTLHPLAGRVETVIRAVSPLKQPGQLMINDGTWAVQEQTAWFNHR